VNSRIEWIDTAKGLGIFLVVLGHTFTDNGLVPEIIWAFHMPLFFFLSGLTAKAWRPGSALTVARSLKSLIIPYIFFSVVSIFFWVTLKDSVSSSEIWRKQLQQMAYGVAGPERHMGYNVPLWFFTCLFSVRLLFAALTLAVPSRPLQIFGVFLFVTAAHNYAFPYFNSMIWNFDVALVALLFFMAGHVTLGAKVVLPFWTKLTRWGAVLTALLLLAASVAANGRVDMNGREFGNPIWFYLGAFSGIALIIEIANRFTNVAFLAFLGRASIVIFPVHCLFSLLPNRIVSIILWYSCKITHSELLAATILSVIEISACLPIYFAINRWAPFLIGQSKKAKPRAPGVLTASPKNG
jgi:fucose 4-O-acetylase-like acetyltransferase